jgi:hypothetical protein
MTYEQNKCTYTSSKMLLENNATSKKTLLQKSSFYTVT